MWGCGCCCQLSALQSGSLVKLRPVFLGTGAILAPGMLVH
uniref:Uncharacterized protein n=1 Tax=Anguilla anguilla TaxID=7936 RepID=A0A0E9ULL7_ANGAN